MKTLKSKGLQGILLTLFCLMLNKQIQAVTPQIAAGANHSVQIKADGTLWAWGDNSFGQLGDGTNTNRSSPVQIGSASNWKSIACGSSHTAALKTDGSLWAWGDNNQGQVDPTIFRGTRKSPTQIGAASYRSIACGTFSTLAIKTDGTLWVWGFVNTTSYFGQKLSNDTNWVSVVAGSGHTLAIKTDGTLWIWATNNLGQLVNESQVGNATDWESLGGQNLAIRMDGSLWLLGTHIGVSPVQIGTDTDWQNIESGGLGGHNLAIKTDGSLWAWGSNCIGQLGDGTQTNKTSPVQIGSATDWQSTTCGLFHTLALKMDGNLSTWGYNFYGQLGNGTTTQQVAKIREFTGSVNRIDPITEVCPGSRSYEVFLTGYLIYDHICPPFPGSRKVTLYWSVEGGTINGATSGTITNSNLCLGCRISLNVNWNTPGTGKLKIRVVDLNEIRGTREASDSFTLTVYSKPSKPTLRAYYSDSTLFNNGTSTFNGDNTIFYKGLTSENYVLLKVGNLVDTDYTSVDVYGEVEGLITSVLPNDTFLTVKVNPYWEISQGWPNIYWVIVNNESSCSNSAGLDFYMEDVRCGNDSTKVKVCHNGREICVSRDALSTHEGHGDEVGGCGTGKVTEINHTGANATAPEEQYANGTSGIKTEDEGPKITISPNPVQSILSVEYGKITSDVMLTDISGKVLLRAKMLNGKCELEMSELRPGFYLLNVEGRAETVKVLKY